MISDRTQQHGWPTAALLLILLSSISVLGQTGSPPATNTARSKTGSITGRVVNESGQPLPNVTVTVRAIGSARSEEQVSTDNDGKFEAIGVEGVSYQIYAWLSAYTPLARDENAPASYRVGESVRIVMTKGGVITGTVTTQSGEPVVGVRVRARMISDRTRLPFPYSEMPFERISDDRGVYRIYGLPAGTYVVAAGGNGGQGPTNADPYDTDVPTYAPASNRDTAAEISVETGAESNNIDIRYRGEPGRIVSGTVAATATGANRFLIVLTSAADGGAEFNLNSYQMPADKGFVFYGVDDGDYDLTARTTVADGQWVLSPPKRIKIRGADVTGIELAVQPLGSVSGQLVLEELKTKECTEKQPPILSETQVSAWHKDDAAARSQPKFVWGLGAPVNADAQGNVLIKNLASGDYYFVTRFIAKSWYVQSISLAAPAPRKPIDAARVWTTVKSGERISGLKIVLAEGAGSLSGQMALAEGEALQDKLFVYLVPIEPERAGDPLRFYAGPVQADGKFSLNNLAPGRYWILTKPTSDGAQNKLRLPGETQTRAQVRRDAEAAKTEIEFKPCQNVADYRLK
jgi:carboxypeptidase family protein